MDNNTKLVILIALGIFIGFGAYRLAEWYFVMYQVEKFTTEVLQEVGQVTARTQQQLEASRRERAHRYQEQQALWERQKREREQKALEANLRIGGINAILRETLKYRASFHNGFSASLPRTLSVFWCPIQNPALNRLCFMSISILETKKVTPLPSREQQAG